MISGFYQRDHSYLYKGQNNKTNPTDPNHWDNEPKEPSSSSNTNNTSTSSSETSNEPYTPSADMVALQNKIILGLQSNATAPTGGSRSAQGGNDNADGPKTSSYTYEEVEMDGTTYYKVTDQDGNVKYVSPYTYHYKIENNPDVDIDKILKDYGKSYPGEEKSSYTINSDGNYVYTIEDSDTTCKEEVRDKDGNLLYTSTDELNSKDETVTSTIEYTDGRKVVTVTDEDDYVVSKITYDKYGNVVDSYTAPKESDNEEQTESAYAKAKREAAEKAAREKDKADCESGKPMDEPGTDLSQDIPEAAKKLPTNGDNKTDDKPEDKSEQEQPLGEPPTSVAPEMPESAKKIPTNPTGQTNPPQGNNNSSPNNNEEDDPIIDGGVLPEVTVTPETNPGDYPPLKEPPTSLVIKSYDDLKQLSPEELAQLRSQVSQQARSSYYQSKYGNSDGTLDTDAMIKDWLDAGGTVITYTRNSSGGWDISCKDSKKTSGMGGGCRKTAQYCDADGNISIEGAGGDALGDRLRERGQLFDLSYNNPYYN